MRSAFERLQRMRQSTTAEHRGAIARLERLRKSWRELAPTEELRIEAETLLSRFPLKGADALQLAAAITWSGSQPKGRVLISADAQLLDAARQLGFQTVSA
jgi:predicted nucleic acid-binding protein